MTIQIFAAVTCIAFVFPTTISPPVRAQGESEPANAVACTVDLSTPGAMSDIVSNALVRGFDKDPSQVEEFLKSARAKYKTGDELATAAAGEFRMTEESLVAAIADYKHCNCTHQGGGEAPRSSGSLEASDGKISDFAKNVLLHVCLHELGHALVREFDLPILGNEETLADAFATHYVVTRIPDRAIAILEARIESLMMEAEEVPRTQWTVQGEHNSDARRAYQICALAIAHDVDKFTPLAELVGMDDSDIKQAADYGTEIHRSWRRILQPVWMPEGQKSNEARTTVHGDSLFAKALTNDGLLGEIENVVRTIDWHSQVTVRFAAGEGGAGWNRSRRTITVHDEYIHRFNCQNDLAASRKK